MNNYRSKCWQSFRREVMELDGEKCRQCGRVEPEVVLQVHHNKYIPGNAAWQYDYKDCETLCKGCHAAEHGKIPPKFGWKYLGYEDLGEVSANCELCGSNYRYQFFVYHKDWGSMLVGSLCCNALTGNEIASNIIEDQVRLNERKQRFVLSKRWVTISGREIIRQKGIRIEISQNKGKYIIQLNHYPGEKRFNSVIDAKSHVFDILENGVAENFIHRRE